MHRSSLFCVKSISSSCRFVNKNFALFAKNIRYIFAFPRPHYVRRQFKRKGGAETMKNRSNKDQNQQNTNQTNEQKQNKDQQNNHNR